MSSQQLVIEGVFNTNYEEHQFNYLRFYADGFVMAATVAVESGDAIDTWEYVQRWFYREYPESSYPNDGQWFLRGKHIRFSVLSEAGAVDYSGRFLGDRMVLDSYSHINGHVATGTLYHRLSNVRQLRATGVEHHAGED